MASRLQSCKPGSLALAHGSRLSQEHVFRRPRSSDKSRLTDSSSHSSYPLTFLPQASCVSPAMQYQLLARIGKCEVAGLHQATANGSDRKVCGHAAHGGLVRKKSKAIHVERTRVQLCHHAYGRPAAT